MKLHFDFKLARFRYKEIVVYDLNTATVYGSSEVLGENLIFKVHGTNKIRYFNTKILLKLNKEKPEFFLLYSGNTIFAVAKIPSCGNYTLESLEYFLVHEGTENINGFMSLKAINEHIHYLMNKNSPLSLD